MVDEAMVTAWREAATRLGVRVIAPYGVELTDGTTLLVEAFLPDFGGQYGAIAVALEDPDRCRQAAKANRFVSQLSPTYRHFDDERFRKILNDWGWFGSPETCPSWYTGDPGRSDECPSDGFELIVEHRSGQSGRSLGAPRQIDDYA